MKVYPTWEAIRKSSLNSSEFNIYFYTYLYYMTDEYFMQQAFKEARKAFDEDEVPVGAVVVMGNKIIARGHNQTERLTDSTAHAEIIALTSAFNRLGSKYLPEATIYITVEPCLMCAGALYWSKIGRVVYGADDEKNGYRRGLRPDSLSFQAGGNGPWPFHPKTELVKGVMKDECAGLMKEFFQSKR
jgi:tRNA(adenine34) deaminase